MTYSQKFSALLLAGAFIVLTACSSSTSSSAGTGQIPTGIYSGVFNGQTASATATSDRAQLSLTVAVDGNTTTEIVTAGDISGNLAITGGSRCFRGGPIASGSLSGDQLSLTIDDATGSAISLTGTTSTNSYNGTFSAANSNCGAVSGGFEFSR